MKDKAEKVLARRAHLQRSFFCPHIERRAKVTPDAVAVEVYRLHSKHADKFDKQI